MLIRYFSLNRVDARIKTRLLKVGEKILLFSYKFLFFLFFFGGGGNGYNDCHQVNLTFDVLSECRTRTHQKLIGIFF